MSKKNRENVTLSVGEPSSPYILEAADDVQICYDRYMADPTRAMMFGDRLFYKIFYRQRFCVRNDHELLVWFDNKASTHIGGILTDELGHRYTLLGIEMFSFVNGKNPDWYLHADAHLISGDIEHLGEYISYATERLCRCIRPPKNGDFVRDELYRWSWTIDGMIAYDNNGSKWSADEIGFAKHFSVVSGKHI